MFSRLCRGRKDVDAVPPSAATSGSGNKQRVPASAAPAGQAVDYEATEKDITIEEAGQIYDLRKGRSVPAGPCMYIQSGDTSDFDGYLIAAAGHVLQKQTPHFEYVIAVPERRAWKNPDEPDTMKHDRLYLEEVMATAGALLRHLCPDVVLVRGLLNQRNIIPWRMMFNEPEMYGPLVCDMPSVDIRWSPLQELADRIRSPELHSVLIDMNGSMGYLDGLVQLLGPEGEKALGSKLKASGFPIIVMAGVQAEVPTQTLPIPGRDPRATKNAIYYPDAVRVVLRLAKEYDVPLLFVTNNVCNKLIKFQDAAEVNTRLGLKGLLQKIAEVWFSMPHLAGKCVPFDWVAFAAMLLHGRQPSAMKTFQQDLWVGKTDPSVLVLRDPSQPESAVVVNNLDGTERYGTVESVTDISLEVLLQLARHAAANTAT